jgi:hypothetical protein
LVELPVVGNTLSHAGLVPHADRAGAGRVVILRRAERKRSLVAVILQ